MLAAEVHDAIRSISRAFADDRRGRQRRTGLDVEDFARLRDAGLLKAGLPTDRGGLWERVETSARPISEIYRMLAGADSSVALVCSMHPAVLAFWLATHDVPAPDSDAWTRQRAAIFDTVEEGAWWGTITSEPGSGGDVRLTRARAEPSSDGRWRITGQKHFGSGSGITSYMLTTAVPDGEERPDWFYVPVSDVTLEDTDGLSIAAPWEGHGMQATQSHALTFDRCRAERVAWPGHLDELIAAAAPFFGTLFTAVVLGIVETAVDAARALLAPRAGTLRAYEQVEWAQAELEAWTMAQVYEGALVAIESGHPAAGASLRAKTIAAQLAESALLRICRVVGGGTFARGSPFGNWFEDVRALGFLRPPWALAYDALIADTWSPTIGPARSSGV
ncbi:MAG: acyl-CoA dehydrogenase family protein [Acidimicrobiales bacterium]